MSHPEQPGSVPPYPAQQYPAQPYPAQPYPGQPVYPYAYAPEPGTNVLAIVSLVSAFFVSLVAIITGHIALSQIKRTGEKGRGLALAGLIIGYAGIAIGAAFIILWLTLVFAIMSHGIAVSGTSA
jgi:peptidyl-prolyl cis-trans isomerase B (cyclophilin B)